MLYQRIEVFEELLTVKILSALSIICKVMNVVEMSYFRCQLDNVILSKRETKQRNQFLCQGSTLIQDIDCELV